MSTPETPELTEHDAYHLMANFFELLKLGYYNEAFNLMESRSIEELEHTREGLGMVAATWDMMIFAKKMMAK